MWSVDEVIHALREHDEPSWTVIRDALIYLEGYKKLLNKTPPDAAATSQGRTVAEWIALANTRTPPHLEFPELGQYQKACAREGINPLRPTAEP